MFSRCLRLSYWLSAIFIGVLVPVQPATSQVPGISFAPVVTYDSGGYSTYSVAIGDLNRDGKPDIVVVNSCGTVSYCAYTPSATSTVGVLFGNGDGTFKKAVTFDSGLYDVQSVEVADVNRDGKPDIVVVSPNRSNSNNVNPNSTIGVFIGNGDGTFQTVATYDSGGVHAIPIVVTDVNNDGKPDIIVGEGDCFWGLCNGTPYVAVLLGNGDGTFQTAALTSTAVPEAGWIGGYYCQGNCTDTALAIADINGDGAPDIVVVDVGLDATPLLGGNGAFFSLVPSIYGGTSIAVADIDHDGKPDLVVTHPTLNSVEILLGNGDGTFQSSGASYGSGGTGINSVVVTDINGDGNSEVVITNAQQCDSCVIGSVGVLQANSDGTFQPVMTYASGGFTAEAVAIADVNGDGKPDLVVANNCLDSGCTGGAVGVLLNTSAPAGTTTTALASSPNPSKLGQSVTFTATVMTSGPKMPTGTVTFLEGSTTLGAGTLNASGVAAFTTSGLAAGQHSIVATYGGYASNAASTSAVLIQTVNVPVTTTALTTTTLASSANPAMAGSSVTFTATVTTSSPGVPTGTVKFLEGSTTLGTGMLNASGAAAFTTSGLAAGQHSITATYVGEASNAASTSSVFSQNIEAADFAVTSSPGAATVSAGNSANFIVALVPQGSFSNTISLSCSGLPALASCIFSPNKVTPNAIATASNLTISTAARSASLALPPSWRPSSPLFAMCFVLPAVVLGAAGMRRPGRRSMLNFAIVCLLAGSFVLLTACGGGSGGSSGGGGSSGSGGSTGTAGTPAGSYTITVVAAAGSVQHTATVTLTVQ